LELIAVPKPGISQQTAGNFIFNAELSDALCIAGSHTDDGTSPTVQLENDITDRQLDYVLAQFRASRLFESVTERPTAP
jgi:hypothetical protein